MSYLIFFTFLILCLLLYYILLVCSQNVNATGYVNYVYYYDSLCATPISQSIIACGICFPSIFGTSSKVVCGSASGEAGARTIEYSGENCEIQTNSAAVFLSSGCHKPSFGLGSSNFSVSDSYPYEVAFAANTKFE